MARVLHGTFSTGYGGLEMVVEDFHKWMLKNGHQSYVIVGEGTPLHQKLLSSGLEETIFAFPPNLSGFLGALKVRKEFNQKDTTFLFHRQAGLKILPFLSAKARVAVLSHTFYGVGKKDFWHRYLFQRVHQWIALTESHRMNMIETCGLDPQKVEVIPNGVDLGKFSIQSSRLPDPSKKIHIGVVARLDSQKGQDVAIRAVHILRQQGFDICLHLFGHETPDNEPYRPVLEKIVRDLNLGEHIVFEGFEAHIEKRLPELDFVWVPSEKETFGLCIIESMACGVPVIASDAGGVPDIIENDVNGLRFEPKNPADLAAKTAKIMAQNGLYLSVRKNALSDVEKKYDQEKVWSRLLKAILPEPQRHSVGVILGNQTQKSTSRYHII